MTDINRLSDQEEEKWSLSEIDWNSNDKGTVTHWFITDVTWANEHVYRLDPAADISLRDMGVGINAVLFKENVGRRRDMLHMHAV